MSERPLKIAYITAGAAGMYCGTCLHDNTLAAKLIDLGHDVSLIPTYTPIRTDEQDVSVGRVFYGAINVYLEQRSWLFRHTPRLLDRLLDAPRLLRWASSHGTSVDARDLGDLTLSVLEGEHGKQRKELEKLVDWLANGLKPDIVHLSNSMQLGMAHLLHERLGVPVVCSLQGEDIFLQDLREPYRTTVPRLMAGHAAWAAAFVAPSRYYAEFMTGFLSLPPGKVHVVPLGVNPSGFVPVPERPHRPFVIGYLARICPEKGLHLLVEAFRRLVERAGRDAARLRIAGYLGQRDRAYFEGVMQQASAWGLDGLIDHVGEIDRAQKIDFLRSLHVLSVPTTYREPKGLFVLEALACGVPVVQPDHGAFPEVIERTRGGILFAPGSAESLADALLALSDNPARAVELGSSGRAAVLRLHTDDVNARAVLDLYRKILATTAAA